MHDILDSMCTCTGSLSRVLCRRGGILPHAVPPGAPLIAVDGRRSVRAGGTMLPRIVYKLRFAEDLIFCSK